MSHCYNMWKVLRNMQALELVKYALFTDCRFTQGCHLKVKFCREVGFIFMIYAIWSYYLEKFI